MPSQKRSYPKEAFLRGGPKKIKSQKSKVDNANISRIARKVLLKAAETKIYAATITSNVTDNTTVAINLNSGIVTGATSVDRLGTKIMLMNIRIHSMFYSNTASNTATKAYRIAVIKTPTRLTATNVTVTATDIFKSGAINTNMTAHFDLKKVKLLYDQTFTTTPTYGSVATQLMLQPQSVSIPVNKSEVYESDSSQYIQSGNYYLCLAAYDGNGVLAPGGFNVAYTLSFKDE